MSNPMPSFSDTVTITAKTAPYVCGVGDYTINLAKQLKENCDLGLDLIVEKSCLPSTTPIVVLPSIEDWTSESFQTLFSKLKQAKVKTVILQYTCWLYSPQGFNLALIPFWQQCSEHFQTILVAHETYYWSFKYPGTWLKGIVQQYVLQQLVRYSDHICCSSERYICQLRRYAQKENKIFPLPIPSNVPPEPLSKQDRLALHQSLGLTPDPQPVLTLFGCYASIQQSWLSRLDRRLQELGKPVVWLLLGDAKKIAEPLHNPVIRPGFLDAIDLSHHLQLSDLMLLPHEFGISAKRTSLMAALEHGIPVIGTNGQLTDSFFHEIESVRLVSDQDYPAFEIEVLNFLDRPSSLSDLVESGQDYYEKHLSWAVVAKTLGTLLCESQLNQDLN
jgi:glycosyltransferase involved in cell wall biosynthesis